MPRRSLQVFFTVTILILINVYYLARSLDEQLDSATQAQSFLMSLESLSGVAGDVALKSSSAPHNLDNEGKEAVRKPTNSTNKATSESKNGAGSIGNHFHIRPSPSTSRNAGIDGCEYPIVIHVTPDSHCTGALALYGSIVRNTLMQPDELENKTCVHFTYVDTNLRTIEEMYRWSTKSNPFTNITDCATLDSTPAYNSIVPVQWQALTPLEKPAKMEVFLPNWRVAANKIHSWAFDLYPRILLLDADSIIVTDLDSIFKDAPIDLHIVGAPDQIGNCGDRNRLNGGMILLRPSRYFHIVITELLYDPDASCLTGKWGFAEQELLNCFCGYNYDDSPVLHMPRPEFKCGIMPIYNSIWPKNYGCSDANVLPMRSIHFTVATKPWLIEDEDYLGPDFSSRFDLHFWKCVHNASRQGKIQELQKCMLPDLEVTRLITMTGKDDPSKWGYNHI